MNIRFSVANVSILCLLTAAFSISGCTSQNSEKHLVDEAWQVINSKFIDITNNNPEWLETRREFLSKNYTSKEAAYNAIQAMLMKLNDPETRFFDSQQFANLDMESRGKSIGIGLIDFSVETDETTKELKVVTALANTPAERAGLQAQDIIQAINKVPTKNLSHNAAMKLLRGEAGTQLILTVRRDGKTFDVPLKREAISVQAVQTLVKQEKGKIIGYIALNQFTPDAPQKTLDAVKELLSKNIDGFILDLRNNPGGGLQASTEIASIFLDKERVGSLRDRTGNLEEFKANNSKLTNKPIVILVNGGTASASEFLAGALQDNKRAVLVGTPTSRRGRVHSAEELSDKSILLVTIGTLLTPAGRYIDREGIKPDYVVEVPATSLSTRKPKNTATLQDAQYVKAIAILTEQLTQTNK